jgi:hypothetical protein
MKSYKLAILTAAAGFLWSLNATAQFAYNNADLLLGFRTPGGTSDLIVDIGAASLYAGASSPITISGNYYTSGDLTSASLTLNNLYFSVFGDISPYNPGAGTVNTLWVTAPQTSNPVQAPAWAAQTSPSQGNTRSQIEAIASGAMDFGIGSSSSVVLASHLNQGSSGDLSYTEGVGANGNFNGNFGSNNNIEQDTSATFSSGVTGSGSVRSDLFEMVPGSSGSYIGFFQLDPDGTLTFNPEPVPEPATFAMFGLGLAGLAGWRRITRIS